MNHSKTRNINLLAGQGATSRTREQNTDYLPQHQCTTGKKKYTRCQREHKELLHHLPGEVTGTVARGSAGLIINFKESQQFKERPKPDGEGAGQDFTPPHLLMEGCSWISQKQSPWSCKQFLYFPGKLKPNDLNWSWFMILWFTDKPWQTLHTSLPGRPPTGSWQLWTCKNPFQNDPVIAKTSLMNWV